MSACVSFLMSPANNDGIFSLFQFVLIKAPNFTWGYSSHLHSYQSCFPYWVSMHSPALSDFAAQQRSLLQLIRAVVINKL